MSNKNTSVKVNINPFAPFTQIITLLICTGSAMVGYTIHRSIFWAIMDFLFWPFAWIKWLVCQEVNMTIIRQTFEFFSK